MERGFKSVGMERSDEGKEMRVILSLCLVIAAWPHPVKLEQKTEIQFANLDLCFQIMTGS